MSSKRLFLALLSVGTLLTLAPMASADCRQKITLTSTGVARDASGTAEKRADGTNQRFKVSIDAAVPDGTTYGVVVNNKKFVGALTIRMGDGELEIENNQGKPDPAVTDPICSITSVAVVEVNNGTIRPILYGSF